MATRQTFAWLWLPREIGFDEIMQPTKLLSLPDRVTGLVEVESMFGRTHKVLAQAIEESPVDGKPLNFYRYMRWKTGYQQWVGFVGPNWGTSSGAVWSTHKSYKHQVEVVKAMELLWLDRYPNLFRVAPSA